MTRYWWQSLATLLCRLAGGVPLHITLEAAGYTRFDSRKYFR